MLECCSVSQIVAILLDGVDYLTGHREEEVHWVETDVAEPGAAAARELLARFLADELTGIRKRLRAGWAAVRWLELQPTAWRGPAWLFALEAKTAGEFELQQVGEDPSEWDPPELPAP